jgi:hypothetical protein
MDPASDWVASGGKGALDFDGTNDYVNLGSQLSFSGFSGLTVSAWFRTTSNSNQVVFAKSRLAAQIARVWITVDTGVVLANGTDSSGGGVSATFATTFSDGAWHFVSAVYGPSTITLFYDGIQRSSVSYGGSVDSTNTSLIGIYNDASGNPGTAAPFNGQIDDVTIYNTALTANEVREIYRLGRGYGVFPEPDFDEGFAAAGFKAHWARRQSQLIGGGV